MKAIRYIEIINDDDRDDIGYGDAYAATDYEALYALAVEMRDALSRCVTEMLFLCEGHSAAEIVIAREALKKAKEIL